MSIPRKPYFVGFSTVDRDRPPYSVTNVELIKTDLLNHFNTPIGARLMLPDYGTRIFEYLMDPQDEITRDAIMEDVLRVVNTEPRVQLVDMNLSWADHAVNITILLNFAPENVKESMFFTISQFDRKTY